jgi:hypothetical protein
MGVQDLHNLHRNWREPPEGLVPVLHDLAYSLWDCRPLGVLLRMHSNLCQILEPALVDLLVFAVYGKRESRAGR